MNADRALSPVARGLMALAAIGFALVGLILFIVPGWAAANFPWKVSPMVAMTMGGWYLGSAAMTGLVAYRRRWNLIYAGALYVGVFSAAEIAVLAIHAAALKLGAALAWPYVVMLALALLAALVALLDWLRQRPVITDEGAPAPTWARRIPPGFALFVFLLAAVAFIGHWTGLKGVIFPEPLSLFTLRSFGAFYFSLGVGALALLRARRTAAITSYVQGGVWLILLITVAAFVYARSFNLAAHPFQIIYPGVYLAALAAALYYLWTQRGERV